MISIAVCDDNEITAQEISEKVKQCCPIEAEVSVFYHIKDILFSIHNENKLFDIIFMDPPYNHEFENRVLEYLSSSPMVTEDTLIIIEASKETDFDWLSDAGFHMIKEKVYKTNKHIFAGKGA
mgnify:CR=1 FL=1